MTLETARQMLGWSQVRLAKEAGERTSAIFDLEAGRSKKPSYILVMRIFKALQRGGLRGVKVEDIFPVPDPPKPSRKGANSVKADAPATAPAAAERRRRERRNKPELAVAS